MTIVEYYEQIVRDARPLDDEMVLIDLGDGRYAAFGPRVSVKVLREQKLRSGTRYGGRPAEYPTIMQTNRLGPDCFLICGDEGLSDLAEMGWRAKLFTVATGTLTWHMVDKVWRSIMTGHPKFSWFAPRIVEQGELVQLRLW